MKSKFFKMKFAVGCGIMCATLLTGCSNASEQSSTSEQSNTSEQFSELEQSNVSEESTVHSESESQTEITDSAETPDFVTEESPLGYSMTYDSKDFILDTSSDVDTYTTKEKLDAPAYISIQLYTDMDTKSLAEGLALQSRTDDVVTDETNIGEDMVKATLVSYSEKVDGKTNVHTFYIVPIKQGNLLVETMGYEGMPETIEAKYEEMLGSFKVKDTQTDQSFEKPNSEEQESNTESVEYPGKDVVVLVNLRGDEVTAYKLADGRYMDRVEKIYIYDGNENWIDADGIEWSEKVE